MSSAASRKQTICDPTRTTHDEGTSGFDLSFLVVSGLPRIKRLVLTTRHTILAKKAWNISASDIYLRISNFAGVTSATKVGDH